MIIEQIELKNFRAYKDVTINFSKSKEKNVTLIYGENGAGKTSFFYAINWCFYGRKFENREIIPKNVRIDGKYLKEELNEGDSDEVSVKVVFSHNNERYTLIRRFNVFKRSDRLDYGEEKVSLDSYNSSGESKKYEEERVDRKINSLIPVTTREYFFFDGEKIDRFSDVGNSREIESSIRAVLGLDSIRNAKDYLHSATKHFDNLVSSDADDTFNRVVKLISMEEDKLKEYKEKLDKLDSKKNEFINDLGEIKKKADQFQQEKDARNKLESIKEEIKSKEKNKKSLFIDLHDELRQSYIGFSIQIHEQAKVLMKKWSDNGVFPSEVFNEDLIDKTLSKCQCLICGNKFKKNDESFKHVESLKGDVLFTREIEKELNEFNGNIKDNLSKGNLNLKNSVDIYAKIQEIITEIDDLISKRDSLKEKITQNISDDELREIFEKQHALETQTIPEIKLDIRRLEEREKESKDNLQTLKNKKEKIHLQSKGEQESKEKSDLCQKAEDAMEFILKNYADEKRKEIDELCRNLFQSLVWKESHFQKVELSEDYLLKVFDKFGEPARPDLSAGERQVLSLAFITAIAKSAGKEAPFIIDTPFGRISKKPRQYIAEQIPNKVSQLILFVTDTELTKESEKIFMDKSEKVWTIRFNQKSSISTIVEGKHVD